jgi:iron complex transport system substrate-binding protein
MLRRSLTALFVLFVILSASVAAVPAAGAAVQADSDCSFPYTTQDATGTNVTVDGEPQRIVVLQASAAQTVWALDAEERVVGAPVNPTTSYLDGIEDKQDVLQSDQFTVSQEAVVELDADIVLAPNVIPDETVASLRDANQTVYKFGFGTSLSFIADKTAETGRLIGACEAAAETNEAYNATVENVSEGTDEYDSPRVMYFTDNFTAGSGTFIDSLITTAGGTNVAAENGVQGYGQINQEALVEWNPEVIVVSGVEGGVPDTDAYASTFAVRNDQVVTVDANFVSQPGPRVVVALQTMAEAFADAELEGEATPTPTEADGSMDDAENDEATEGGDAMEATATATAESTDGDGAGFGVAAALVALLSVALLARR